MVNKEKKWVPTPRFLCRKAIYFDLLKNVNKGSFLEIGVGAGDLFLDMLSKGYCGLGIDVSEEAVEMTKKRVANNGLKARVECKDFFDIEESFDLIVCLEVLEHVEDDEGFLRKIYSCINSNGYLILSVPAHYKKWGNGDIWAGHYRRYEKKELQNKLENAGFMVLKNYNYGFPLTNILSPIRDHFLGKDIAKNDISRSKRNEASGIDRGLQSKYSFLINDFTMAPFLFIQKIFLKKDLGDGHIVFAKKK